MVRKRRKFGPHRQHLVELRAIFHQAHRCVDLGQDEAELLRRAVRAARHVGGAQPQNGQIGDQPLPPVVGQEADAVTAPYAQFLQAGGKVADLGIELRVRGGLEPALRVLAELGRYQAVVVADVREQLGNRILGSTRRHRGGR